MDKPKWRKKDYFSLLSPKKEKSLHFACKDWKQIRSTSAALRRKQRDNQQLVQNKRENDIVVVRPSQCPLICQHPRVQIKVTSVNINDNALIDLAIYRLNPHMPILIHTPHMLNPIP